jgi:sugar lactone lactonase YvrE
MSKTLSTANKSVFLAAMAVISVIQLTAISAIASAADENPVLFYPPLPDEPRLQYLRKFSSRLDLSAKSSRLRNLVFGGEEFEGQDIIKAYGVAIFEGAIYAIDTEQNGYVVFDVAADETRIVKGSGQGGLDKPINITIDTDGTRYVTDTQRDIVVVFDRKDRYVRTLGESGQFKPVDVAIAGDRLYISDITNMKIHVLDKTTGETLFDFGERGDGEGEFLHPTNLAIGPDETLYVTDTNNFRIQHFTLDGEYIRSIGNIGTAPGKFARPKGVALDRDGLIYVVDAAFENVQLLDNGGTPLTSFGRPGSGPGGINLPTVVKVDYDNVKYFQDYAAPGFELEYLVVVGSQFGNNKVAIFGFGAMNEELGGAYEGGR